MIKVMDLALSDHTVQILKIPVKRTYTLNHWRKKKRDISMHNLQILKKHLQCLSFNDAYKEAGPNLGYNEFIERFRLHYNLCFPFKVTINLNNKSRWISKGIKLCSKRQRQLLWGYQSLSSEHNKQVFKLYSRKKNV